MKLSKQQLADIFDDAADFDGSNEQAVYARKALLAGTLEIEGYIRADHFADAGKMGWTKFDPDKRDTYPPPKGKEFLLGVCPTLTSAKRRHFSCVGVALSDFLVTHPHAPRFISGDRSRRLPERRKRNEH